MTYLFVNPEVKKWRILFFLSALFNLVLIIALYFSSSLTDSDEKNAEIAAVSAEEGSDSDIIAPQDGAPQNAEPKVQQVTTLQKGAPITISLIIKDNFFSSFTASDAVTVLEEKYDMPRLDRLLSAHAARLLIFDLLLRKDVRNGDAISLVFRQIPEEERANRDDLPDTIEILSLVYKSKRLNKTIQIFRFQKPGDTYSRYYYADGQQVEPTLQKSPIKDYIQVTATLRDRRPKHDGVDFKSPTGTPVLSTVDGSVVRTNWKRRYNGYCIELKDHAKHTLKYLHMSSVTVEPGQAVKIGQQIGESGNTGKSTAPHLHYQINVGTKGKVLNPFKQHKTKVRVLSGNDLKLFRKKIAEIRNFSSGHPSQ
ncbi:M23 family metallopeptidase [bacterium]|nr:M23 family metallopeptidase [bacterium]